MSTWMDEEKSTGATYLAYEGKLISMPGDWVVMGKLSSAQPKEFPVPDNWVDVKSSGVGYLVVPGNWVDDSRQGSAI